jgi:hypothetical protein
MRRRFHTTPVFQERLYTLAIVAFGALPVALTIFALLHF